uniref:Indoleacetamide hydrolase (IAH) ) n=1 Tax=Ganoderma boninense TaxID=34458 RepID=A0A5K1K8A2_9APHY|nr:Indoleacetamide hydrolase (IAH) (EC (Indole-3-acetamide hydrolase) [Ganoderma boninense]
MQLWFALVVAMTPSLASAALFPKDTLVKQLDAKGFRKAMKENATSVVAFVAPWCGHCQRMAPEFSKAALGVYPMIPFYAVDCDKQSNKQLCAEQGVQGFPTVKARLSSRADIPHNVKKVYHLEDLPAWVEEVRNFRRNALSCANFLIRVQNKSAPRAVLLNQGKHIPLLWQTLGNKYKGQITFAIHRDRKGKSSVKMGLEKGEPKSSKVLLYPAGSTDYVRYEGIQKHDSLSKFFDSVLDGTADLSTLNKQAAEEEFVPDEEMLEIERKQEAQRMALAHGGFNDLIDFEEAIKNGAGADFHEKHGFPGMMGGALPKKGEAKGAAEEEDPIRKILKAQQEAEKSEREKPKMAKTDEAGQVVFTPEVTGHPKTPVAGESATTAETDAAESASVTLTKREEAADDAASSPSVGEEDPGMTSARASEAASAVPTEELKTRGHVTDEL